MKFRFSLLLNIVLAVLLAWSVSHKSAPVPPVAAAAPPPTSHIEGELEDFTYRYKVDSFANRPITLGSMVMLGDSLTDLGAWSEFFPGVRIINRGISGDNTYGVLHRIDQVIAHKPAKVFLLVGTNDLFWNSSVEDAAARYSQILDKLRSALPDTKIYVQSVFPFNRLPRGDYGYLDNAKAAALNTRIKELAVTANATYIDLWPALADSSGQLDQRYTTDGIHLNGAGYVQWAGVISKYIGRTQGSK